MDILNLIVIKEIIQWDRFLYCIQYVRDGIYYLQTRHLLEHIPKLDKKNASGELYLTDIMQYIENIDLIHLQNRFEIYNINTLEDLENATKINIRR